MCYNSVILDDKQWDTEIRMFTVIEKGAFQKLIKVLILRKLYKELNCYVILYMLYGIDCWTISPEIDIRLEATGMRLYWWMLRILWTEYLSKNNFLGKIGIAMNNYNQNYRAKIYENHSVKRVLTGDNEIKWSKENQSVERVPTGNNKSKWSKENHRVEKVPTEVTKESGQDKHWVSYLKS